MTDQRRPPRSLDGRLIALGAIVLVIALPLFLDLFSRAGDPISSQPLEGSSLWILLVVAMVAALVLFAAVLRTASRMWMRRRHVYRSLFGPLWVTIYAASLISLALWMGIVWLMIKAVDRVWSDTALQTVLTQGNALAQEFAAQMEDTTRRDASLVANEADPQIVDLAPDQLGDQLRALLERFDVDYLAVYSGRDFVHAVLDPDAGLGDLPEPGSAFLDGVATNQEAVRMPPRQRGRLVIAGRKLNDAQPPTLVLVGNVLEEQVVSQRRTLVEAYQGLRRIQLNKNKWRAVGYSLLVILGLVGPAITFIIARTVGDHFDRSVGALQRATERLARGDPDGQAGETRGDELETVTARLNLLADELEARGRALQKAHRETEAERALVRAVNEGVAAGIVAIDDEGVITVLNRAARELLALGGDPVVGRPLSDVLNAQGLKPIADTALGPVTQARNEVRVSVRGHRKVFEAKLRELKDIEGQHTGRVMVLEDLTSLIQAKETGAWRDAARKVAHEIRNPLTPIQLSAERLRKKSMAADPDLGPAVADAADTIVSEVETMKRMVDEFSQYARLAQPMPQPTDVDELLQATARFYSDVMPGVSVVASPNGELGHAVLDPNQIRRVLNNLVENAVDAVSDSDREGSVTLSAHLEDDELVIEIADDGVGVSDEEKARMFLPHFSTKRRGSGLGLAISERIVREHQGSIEVRDNQPRGTVVAVRLPIGGDALPAARPVTE